MAFIGIITSKKNESVLKRVVNKSIENNTKRQSIIIINEKNIENIKNVKFDIIIINEESEIIGKKPEIVKMMVKKTRYLILNTDIYSNLLIIKNLELTVITFGLNLKATVLASSLQKNNICISIQRQIKNFSGHTIEPNEKTIKTDNIDIYSSLVGYILEIL